MSTSNWQKITGSLKRVMIWLIILSIWEGAYRVEGRKFWILPQFWTWKPWKFPAPSHVLDATLGMLNVPTAFGDPVSRPGWPKVETPPSLEGSGTLRSPLISANLVSGLRLLIGFSISLGLGAALGALMWRWKELDAFLGPVFLGLQTLPSVCWVPLAILRFGYNERGILFVLVMGSFFAIAISLRDGLKLMPPIYQRAGLMLGAKGWKLYRYILLPASLPALAGSLRQGFSFAWRSLMGAELIFVVGSAGLGHLLDAGRQFNDIAQVVAVMIMMVLIGMVVDRWVFAILQRKVQARFGLAGVILKHEGAKTRKAYAGSRRDFPRFEALASFQKRL